LLQETGYMKDDKQKKREERLAEALRTNLAKRKQQARARRRGEEIDGETPVIEQDKHSKKAE
jgi:hypothetical protein